MHYDTCVLNTNNILFCRQNISYASMCNGAGQAFGIFLGYILPILLLSESFWNKWWRTTSISGGVITLQGTTYTYLHNILYTYINV